VQLLDLKEKRTGGSLLAGQLDIERQAGVLFQPRQDQIKL